MVKKAGLTEKFRIDSAGMSSYHIGEPAHKPAIEAAKSKGYELLSIARKFTLEDFDAFDYILPMDQSNISQMLRMASTQEHKDKIIPFIHLTENLDGHPDVPDPYYGGKEDYHRMLDLVEEGCKNLLERIRKENYL